MSEQSAVPTPGGSTPSRLTLGQLRRRARAVAAGQAGVLCRRQLAEHGLPRWLLQLETRAGRWQRTGRQTVVVHNGPLRPAEQRVVAAFEAGPRAALDGASALQHAGVTSLTDTVIHVIAPRGSQPPKVTGARVHESRRFREQDVFILHGVRTVRAPVAAVHAALWARTDREASLFLILAVQQRLADAASLADAVEQVRRHTRRRLLRRVLAEVTAGVRSLGELDVAVAMRRRGLPEPDRQAVRRRASGTEYLDARFAAYRLTLEVDGSQHDAAEHRVADVLRDFAQAAEGDLVLRLPLVVWRLAEDAVLNRLEAVFAARGWQRPSTFLAS